jgi:hypothetical protein
MRASFDYAKAREERLQLLRFLAALAIFICALHLMCARDAQIALARAEALGHQPVTTVLNPAWQQNLWQA